MRVKEALLRATQMLATVDREEARLEAELLMRHLLSLGRAELFGQWDRGLGPLEEEDFWGLVECRLQGEPLPYIVGHREFFGLDLYVDKRVLIPRPETELLVEKALELLRGHPCPEIADVGTGSGAIAVALAKNLPRARLYALDVSAAALEVAAINCSRHEVVPRVELLHGDLLEPLPGPVDLIVANLPYVKQADLQGGDPRLEKEPRLALDGGEDGLGVVGRLLGQTSGRLRKGGHLSVEMGQGQREALQGLVGRWLPQARVDVFRDLGQIERAALISFPF